MVTEPKGLAIARPALRPIVGAPDATAAAQSKVLRQQTAAQSHNVFRPDIYRVSEGYLN